MRLAFITLIWLGCAPVALADLRLMMVEQPGCIHCAQWDAQIAPIYPLTDEGRAAPLLRQQLRDPLPPGVVLDAPPVFTPTFILLQDGTEAARLQGYPGEDFFWGLLSQMLDTLPRTSEETD